MASTDFILFGAAEEGGDVRYALLPSLSNHRRCLLKPVMLTSNNEKLTDFITEVMAEEEASRLDAERARLPAASRLGAQRVIPQFTRLSSNNNKISDFVVFITAEEELARLDAERGRLPPAARLGVERVLPKRTLLTSNNAGATDFVLLPNPCDDEPLHRWDTATEPAPRRFSMQDLEARRGLMKDL